jgi:hypothetical protein
MKSELREIGRVRSLAKAQAELPSDGVASTASVATSPEVQWSRRWQGAVVPVMAIACAAVTSSCDNAVTTDGKKNATRAIEKVAEANTPAPMEFEIEKEKAQGKVFLCFITLSEDNNKNATYKVFVPVSGGSPQEQERAALSPETEIRIDYCRDRLKVASPAEPSAEDIKYRKEQLAKYRKAASLIGVAHAQGGSCRAKVGGSCESGSDVDCCPN